jgi:hypothetical protein
MVLAAIAGVAVVIVANLSAIRLVPTYAEAVSHAPFVSALPRQVLEIAGLSEVQVSRVRVSATSSGHTVTLLAAAADSARTFLLIQVDGHDSLPSKTAAGFFADGTLTDQYGHTYQAIGGQGGDLSFAPLTGRAASGPVQITLHIDFLDLWPASAVGNPAHERIVKGEWVIGTTVTKRAAVAVPLPAPRSIGNSTYTVTSIRISGTSVTIDWKLEGDPRIAALFGRTKDGTWPPRGDPRLDPADKFLSAWILNADGSTPAGHPNSYGYSLVSERLAVGTVEQVLPAHGDYLLRIGQHPPVVDFAFKVP